VPRCYPDDLTIPRLLALSDSASSSTPPPRLLRETALCVLGLACLAVVAYGPHWRHGGFVNDDWSNGYLVHQVSLSTAIHFVDTGYAQRPVLALYLPLTYKIFGSHIHQYLAYIAMLGVAMSAAFYAVARCVGANRAVAGALAALSLVLPLSDGPRLWIASSGMSVSIAVFGLGFVVAAYAFRTSGAKAVLLHAVSVCLYVTSILLFEVTVGLVAILVLGYLRLVPRRPALLRWGVDVAATGTAVLVFTIGQSTSYQRLGIAATIRNGWNYAGGAVTLIARTVVPVHGVPRAVGWLVIVGLVAVSVAAIRRPAWRPSALLAIAGLLVVATGYVPFVSGKPTDYNPLYVGGQNRTNITAGLGYALLAVAVIVALGRLVQVTTGDRRAAYAVSGFACLLIVGGNVIQVRSDVGAWDRAQRVTHNVIGTVKLALPHPPPMSVILVFGNPAAYGPQEVPILEGVVDTTNALRSSYDRPDLQAGSIQVDATVACNRRAMRTSGPRVAGITAPYGHTVFVDVVAPSATVVRSPAQCRTLLATLPRAPVFADLPR
jgi:hypothetical protein